MKTTQAAVKTRKNPRQHRSQETFEAILQGAAHILMSHGFEGATTNRIAERAGVSIGSLYQYFPNKEAIVATLVEQMFSEGEKILRTQVDTLIALPFNQALEQLIDTLLKVHERAPKLRRILLEQVPRVGRMKNLMDHQSRDAVLTIELLRKRPEKFRPQDLELAAFILLHAVEGVILAASGKNPALLKSPEFRSELVQLVLNYLGPKAS